MTKKKSRSRKRSNHFLPKKVGILFSEVKKEYFPTHEQYLTESEALPNAQVVAQYLNKLGIKTILFPGDATLAEKLRRNKVDMVLNLVDSLKGSEYSASTIPALLEILEIPYTGSEMLAMSLNCNKFLLKKLLQQNGIPMPNYQLFNSPNDLLNPALRFPLISKLNEIHGAVEINDQAISETEKELRDRLRYLINTYEQPVLVEEFIVGRELTAILLEGLNKKVYLAERIFRKKGKKYSFISFADQWMTSMKETAYYHKYNDPVLREYIKRAFDILEMADYAKFDVRLDYSGRYYFLDCNANPYFGPKEAESDIANIADLYGLKFSTIIKRVLMNTMREAAGESRLPITNNH